MATVDLGNEPGGVATGAGAATGRRCCIRRCRDQLGCRPAGRPLFTAIASGYEMDDSRLHLQLIELVLYRSASSVCARKTQEARRARSSRALRSPPPGRSYVSAVTRWRRRTSAENPISSRAIPIAPAAPIPASAQSKPSIRLAGDSVSTMTGVGPTPRQARSSGRTTSTALKAPGPCVARSSGRMPARASFTGAGPAPRHARSSGRVLVVESASTTAPAPWFARSSGRRPACAVTAPPTTATDANARTICVKRFITSPSVVGRLVRPVRDDRALVRLQSRCRSAKVGCTT